MPKAPKSTRPGRRERMAARDTADRTATLEPETTSHLLALYLLYENFPFLTEFLLNPTPDQSDQPRSSSSSGPDQPGPLSSSGDQPESSSSSSGNQPQLATRYERGQLWIRFTDKIGVANKPILSKAIVSVPDFDLKARCMLIVGHRLSFLQVTMKQYGSN
jgi:hypothetical protein